MFKICMKNYVNSLKYVFVALGVMFIALILGAQTTVNRSVKEVKNMVSAIEETTQSSDLSLERIGDSFTNTFDAIKDNLNPEVIAGEEKPTEVEESIGEAIGGVVENYIAYLGDIISFIAAAIAGIIIAIVLFFVIFIIGTIFSSTLITMFGRYDVNKDNVFRIILEQLARIVIIAAWIGLTFVISLLSVTAGIIVAVFFPLVYCYIALFSFWLTAGDARRPKYGGYVTFKNVIIIFASHLIEIVIAIALTAIAYLIFGVIVAAMFAIALIVLAASNVNINAYAFFFNIPEVKAAVEGKTKEIQAGAEVQGAAAAPQIILDPVKKEEEKTEGAQDNGTSDAEVKPEEVRPESAAPAPAAATVSAAAPAEEAKPEEVKTEADTPAPSAAPAEEVRPEEVKPEADTPAPSAAPAEEVRPEEVKPEADTPAPSAAPAEEVRPEEVKPEADTPAPSAVPAEEVRPEEIKTETKKEDTIRIDIEG